MLRRNRSRNPRQLLVLAVAGLLGLAATSASAETGTAVAQDVAIHINLLGIATLDVDPQVPLLINNETTATYLQDSLPGLDLGGTLLHLTSSTLAAEAEYAPGGAISAAGARASVEDLNLSAVDLLGTGLLSINASLIQSRSQVMGYCLPSRASRGRDMFDDITFFNGFDTGNINGGGPNGSPGPDDVVLEDLGISILGIPIPDLPLNPPPNTIIDLSQLGIVGATLILNEQTFTGDGVNMGSLTSNAVHLTLNVAGLITADVVIAHSEGKLDCTQ
jgi:hypothetical protein